MMVYEFHLGDTVPEDRKIDTASICPAENAQQRQYRNGATRPGLQHEMGNEHSGRC